MRLIYSGSPTHLVPSSTSWSGNLARTKVIRLSVQGTALYELYLSIQQRALRAFHDPGTWGGLGSGDVLSMLTMAGEHLQVLINTHKALDMCNCAPLCSRNALIV